MTWFPSVSSKVNFIQHILYSCPWAEAGFAHVRWTLYSSEDRRCIFQVQRKFGNCFWVKINEFSQYNICPILAISFEWVLRSNIQLLRICIFVLLVMYSRLSRQNSSSICLACYINSVQSPFCSIVGTRQLENISPVTPVSRISALPITLLAISAIESTCQEHRNVSRRDEVGSVLIFWVPIFLFDP